MNEITSAYQIFKLSQNVKNCRWKYLISPHSFGGILFVGECTRKKLNLPCQSSEAVVSCSNQGIGSPSTGSLFLVKQGAEKRMSMSAQPSELSEQFSGEHALAAKISADGGRLIDSPVWAPRLFQSAEISAFDNVRSCHKADTYSKIPAAMASAKMLDLQPMHEFLRNTGARSGPTSSRTVLKTSAGRPSSRVGTTMAPTHLTDAPRAPHIGD